MDPKTLIHDICGMLNYTEPQGRENNLRPAEREEVAGNLEALADWFRAGGFVPPIGAREWRALLWATQYAESIRDVREIARMA